MTADTGKTVEEQLDEILDFDRYIAIRSMTLPITGEKLTEARLVLSDDVKATVKQALIALIAQEQLALIERVRTEVIGDDEVNPYDGFSEDLQERDSHEFISGENWLRDQQRTALDSLEAEIKEGKDATKE